MAAAMEAPLREAMVAHRADMAVSREATVALREAMAASKGDMVAREDMGVPREAMGDSREGTEAREGMEVARANGSFLLGTLPLHHGRLLQSCMFVEG